LDCRQRQANFLLLLQYTIYARCRYGMLSRIGTT
jgi:hypothetical protein